MNLGLILLIIFIVLLGVVTISYIIYYVLTRKKEISKSMSNLKSILLAFCISLLAVDFAILVPLSFSTTLWKEGEKFDYKEYREVNVKDIFKNENAYIYFYSYACPICDDIKEDVLGTFQGDTSFYLVSVDKEKDELKFAFESEENCLNSGGVYENDFCAITTPDYKNKMLGVSDINNFYLIGTPTLLKIEEYKINEIAVGDIEILNMISEVK